MLLSIHLIMLCFNLAKYVKFLILCFGNEIITSTDVNNHKNYKLTNSNQQQGIYILQTPS